MRYYKVIIRIDDDTEELDEERIESAIEDTLEYLPYDLEGTVQRVEETDEDFGDTE